MLAYGIATFTYRIIIRAIVCVSMLGVLATPARAACDCASAADCAAGNLLKWFCTWSWCSPPAAHPSWDGWCLQDNIPWWKTQADYNNAIMALDLWLQAYEQAGSTGGGPPGAALADAALSIPLSPDQHQGIRRLAIQIVGLYLGLKDHPLIPPLTPGLFLHPEGPGSIPGDPLPDGENGTVDPLDATLLGVAALVRQAVIGELQNPGAGEFDTIFDNIATSFPAYEPFFRCQFPRPVGLEDFTYADGMQCMREELRSVVTFILNGRFTPSISVFVDVLLGVNTNPDDVAASDINDDGVVDGNDIGPYVEAVLGL